MLITDVNDYIDRIIENHPELTEKQIRYILHFGMISFDNYLRRGFSIKLASPKVTMWVGEKYTNDLKQRFENKARRIRRKARFNYTFDKEIFDGYYYFYLNETLFQSLKPFNRKAMKVEKLRIFKSFEECFLMGTDCYIFKFYYPTDLGFQHLLENEIIRNYEFLGKKENGKLKRKKYVKRNKK